MSRSFVVIVLIGLAFSGFVAYNLFLRPPPTPTEVITLLNQQSMPGIMGSDGMLAATPSAAPLRVVNIVAFPWGVVAVYTNDQGYGTGTLERGWLGWDFASFGWGSATEMTPGKTITYDYTQEYAGYTRPYAEVIWGTRDTAQASAVRIRFDDTTTLTQTITVRDFSIITDQHGGACVFEVLDGNDMVLETHRLTPRVPHGLSNTRYDCEP